MLRMGRILGESEFLRATGGAHCRGGDRLGLSRRQDDDPRDPRSEAHDIHLYGVRIFDWLCVGIFR